MHRHVCIYIISDLSQESFLGLTLPHQQKQKQQQRQPEQLKQHQQKRRIRHQQQQHRVQIVVFRCSELMRDRLPRI